jgi:hypothetical protein
VGKPQQIRLKSFNADFFKRALAAQASPPTQSQPVQAPSRSQSSELRPEGGVEKWLINEAEYIRRFGY